MVNKKPFKRCQGLLKKRENGFIMNMNLKSFPPLLPQPQKRSLEINLKWAVMLRVPAGATKNIKNVVVRGSFPHLF